MSSAAPSTLETTPRVRAGAGRVFAVVWAITALLMICWAYATPLSAAPDEPAHAVKAASVARGQFVGEPSVLGHIVQVPRYIASMHAETCFAFNDAVPAGCAEPLPGDPGEIIDSTTTAGLYNPVYYLAVGWPTLIFHDDAGIYAMRIVSAILTALFVALAAWIVARMPRPGLPLAAIAVAATPMLLFLGGTVNPNAIEATATLATLAAIVAILMDPRPDLLARRATVMTISAAVAVNARGLSPLWVAVALLVPLLLVPWRDVVALLRTKAVLWSVGIIGAATAFAIGWILFSPSLAAPIDEDDFFREFPGVGMSPLAGFIAVLRDTFGYAKGLVGIFGWLDTVAPIGVYGLWAAFTGAIIATGFAVLRGRRLLVASLLLAAVVFLPPIIQGAYVTTGGMIWQGRYTLPLYGILVLGTVMLVTPGLSAISDRTYARLLPIAIIPWAVAQGASFATALKRYVVGEGGTWGEFLNAPQWSAPGGNLTWIGIAALVLIATCVLSVVSSRRLSAVEDRSPATVSLT